MAADVSISAALFAGILSFLSPCVLPLVPPYLSIWPALRSSASPTPNRNRRCGGIRCCAACLFVLGFSTVFVALGASASVYRLADPRLCGPLAIVAGVVIIIMGLHFLGVTRIALMYREKRMDVPKPVGLWGAYVMGLAFAFGWTPCIGPILAVDPGGRRLRGRPSRKEQACSRSIRWAWAFRSSSRLSRSNRSPPFSRVFKSICAGSNRRWAGCWSSPVLRFSPAV